MFARRAAVAVAVTAAILLTGAASSALEPVAGDAVAARNDSAQSPHPRGHADGDGHGAPTNPDPGGSESEGSHTVRIHVSGPDDTRMRVIRDRRGTGVALGGRPFDYAFTEPPGSDGHLGIKVAAASKQGGPPAVRCTISINGQTVTRDAAATPDESGLAQVLCTVPRHV